MHFKAGKGSGPTSQKFLQMKGGKNISYLEGGMGGGTRALTKEIDPR